MRVVAEADCFLISPLDALCSCHGRKYWNFHENESVCIADLAFTVPRQRNRRDPNLVSFNHRATDDPSSRVPDGSPDCHCSNVPGLYTTRQKCGDQASRESGARRPRNGGGDSDFLVVDTWKRTQRHRY